ncbi:MAG: hypothetical protein IJK23_14180 [Clostridia bacterium]|nr:hypothetical protein [Clostridia bacterium]
MLYKKNSAPELSDELFKNPGCEYRGAPFWAWNCKLEKDELLHQIECFKEMGLGGYHMHPRVGFATEYLSEEFMELVKACVEKGKQIDMNSYLYDEDRWPSGAAGGYVTKNKRLRGKYFEFTQEKRETVSFEEMYNAEKPCLYAEYDVLLNDGGYLTEYRRIADGGEVKGMRWYAYLYVRQNESWYNNQAYVDTLNPEAMDEFIRVTYGAYDKAVGKDFGDRVPSIFTDEPQFMKMRVLPTPRTGRAVMPWTEALPELFEQRFGKALTDVLPEIFFENANGVQPAARYHYINLVSDLFAENFAGRCGKWCDEHGLALTGHLMNEPELCGQTEFVGDAMRSYRYFGIPGIDMLCDNREFTTAKQCQSAVHQCGKEAMLSELYGVTSWDYDFKHHKSQGDWQAALGVTLRVPHLSMVSMKGEAKRDYPASISYQSPWYGEYSAVEDHFARVNAAMTRGKPLVNIAVLHPIESFWLLYGPSSQMHERGQALDGHFHDLASWMLYACEDFNYLNEATLPEFYGGSEGGLHVGKMTYSAVLVPDCITMRKTTLDILKEFAAAGGKVIFAGNIPEYLDAAPSDEVKRFAASADCIPFDKIAVTDALAPYKDADLKNPNGMPARELICSMRQDSGCKWMFIAQGERLPDWATLHPQDIVITVKGEYEPLEYDTVTGEIKKLPFRIEGGKTLIPYHIERTGSLLVKLCEDPAVTSYEAPAGEKKSETVVRVFDKVGYTRCEPNVLLLDRAEYAMDGAPLAPAEEILRLNNICREKLGWPEVGGHMAQPWVVPADPPVNTLTLRFTFESEINCEGALLALEDAENAGIELNGERVSAEVVGYFADRDIHTVKLPEIRRGENELTVKIPYGRRTSAEWCYILGEFNVRVEGCVKTLVPATEKIGFGPITTQGMPFYGGNLVYKTTVRTPAGDAGVRIPHVRGALARVKFDGKDLGRIAWAPFTVDAGRIEAGEHSLEILFFGNRFNTFGPLHSLRDRKCIGPGEWRTGGDDWSYEYNLNPTGVMDSPEIIVKN